MLGLLLIYFIGKTFYELADAHQKHKWGYAILGVVSYYVGTFLAGIILGFGGEFLGWNWVYELPDIALNFMALPFGLFVCWLTYRTLKKNWEGQVLNANEDILDATFEDEDF